MPQTEPTQIKRKALSIEKVSRYTGYDGNGTYKKYRWEALPTLFVFLRRVFAREKVRARLFARGSLSNMALNDDDTNIIGLTIDDDTVDDTVDAAAAARTEGEWRRWRRST